MPPPPNQAGPEIGPGAAPAAAPASGNETLFPQPEVLQLLACPGCYQPLVLRGSEVACSGGCGRLYPIVDGVPVLLVDRALPAASESDRV